MTVERNKKQGRRMAVKGAVSTSMYTVIILLLFLLTIVILFAMYGGVDVFR